MIIGLAEELGTACIGKPAEAFDDLRSISVELLEGRTGYGECHLEGSLVGIDEVEQKPVHRKIALLRNPPENRAVREVIIIM